MSATPSLLPWIAGLLVVIPWMNPFTGGPSAAAIPWLVSATCGIGLFMLSLTGSVGRVHWPLVAGSAGLVAWAALSHPTVSDGATALAAGLMLVCLAATAVTVDGVGRAMRGGLLLAAALSAIFGLLQYMGVSQVLDPWVNYAPRGEAYGNLRQPNQYATLCWLGMAVLLWGVPRLPRRCAFGLAILLASASAISVSRTGMLQGLLLFALCVLWPGPDRRRNVQLCVVATLAYIAATLLMPVLLEVVSGAPPARRLWSRLSGSYGCSSRAILWSNVVTLIAKRPLAGWGWGELDFAHFVTLYNGPRFCEILDNAHNLPLHLAVELGVPAAVLVCIGGVVWGWRQRPWREQDPQRQLAWALIGVILLHNMLEYPLWYGPFQLAFGAAFGWLRADVTPQTAIGARRAIIGGAIAMLLAGACAYAAWDYWRVSQVYLSPQHRRDIWRNDPLRVAKQSRLFAAQARFAELTLSTVNRSNAASMAPLAREMLHYSPEPRVVERLIEADTMLGNDAEAVLTLARFRAAFPDHYEQWRRTQGVTGASVSPRAQD